MKNDDQDENQGIRGRWEAHKRLHKLHKLEHLRRVQFGQRGFLRPEIIGLFEQQPMSGVDIMNKLQEMSHGWYRPSPGSIYPILEQLEKEGLIAKNKDGKYELTSAYGEQGDIGGDLASALSAMESNASYLEDLQRTDAAGLSKYKDRIEKLRKRLEALSGASQSGSSP